MGGCDGCPIASTLPKMRSYTYRLRKLFCCLGIFLAAGTGHGGELKLLTHNVWYGFTTDAPGHPAE